MSPRITDVEAIWLRVPRFDQDCEWGEDALIVRVHTDSGIVGVGESDSSPAVLKAIIETPASHATSRGLRQILLGEPALDIAALWQRMYDESSYYGRRGAAIHAISAIDIALWDIASQYHNRPIHELLGGRKRDSIMAYGTFIPDSDPDANESASARMREAGFRALKLGGGRFGIDPDHDERVVAAARRGAGREAALALDLVYRWRNADHAIAQIRRLHRYDLAWVEEPLPPEDQAGLRRLSEESPTPVAGGECLSVEPEFREFIEQTHPALVQPDITRAGGFTGMLRIADLARRHRTRLVPHGFSTGILLAATAQLLAALPDGDLIEYSQSTSPLFTDLVENAPRMTDGAVPVSTAPGLGVRLNADLLERYRVEVSYSTGARADEPFDHPVNRRLRRGES